jgi:hypothetical protein
MYHVQSAQVGSSPISQNPLPQTGKHPPDGPVSQQSAPHESCVSPASQNPLPQTGKHAPDGPVSQQSFPHESCVSPISQNPLPHTASQ